MRYRAFVGSEIDYFWLTVIAPRYGHGEGTQLSTGGVLVPTYWQELAPFMALVGAAATALAFVLVLWRIAGRPRTWRDRAAALVEPSLEDRLDELSKTMKRSAQLLGVVTAEMDLRRAEVDRLQGTVQLTV